MKIYRALVDHGNLYREQSIGIYATRELAEKACIDHCAVQRGWIDQAYFGDHEPGAWTMHVRETGALTYYIYEETLHGDGNP